MVPEQQAFSLKGIGMLLRIIAVIFSSMIAILSTILPLFFHYTLEKTAIISVSIILCIGAILIHGVLTHSFNDLTDYKSGTDKHSPGILSGGSKVLLTGTLSVQVLVQIGVSISTLLLLAAYILYILGYTKLAVLTLVGLWGASSYSLRPFRLAYYPFAGEWISLFPAILLLGIAAPWILLEQIPTWAWQNALINALWCMAWVMVHHIPDRHADRKAQPIKRTSVVWAEDMFGNQATKFPVILYFTLIGMLLVWTAFTRPIGAVGSGLVLLLSISLILKMDVEDIKEVTNIEKGLLLCAFVTAVWLGIFMK